ncbi:hypothetical protein EPA93_28270 [Ktedonosporobacter rubrisoli]|uniref:Pesticidal crystal protein domain-containing protein n=1 Tax=Ktedonosporobacter rubrisoli TaxID=2509675 RepID=A0A4P6JW86_KTERU|nr:insecticidal delta-endotoxin Cry8Ea1 family protein [Ktedonosporobacter rubrisoli]QBD79663.1 hypothetical protein EPA93_28270 [Ktedonosporobacter rubrisoli]
MEDANQARNLSDASEHSEWVSPELQPPAYPQGGPPEFYSIDWNNAAKIALTTGLKFVPYVGSILGGLVSILWPSSKEDVWEDIREKVEKLIDEKIAQRTYNEIKNALKGLHNNIDEYQNALQYSQGNPDVISENWTTAHNLFVNDLPDFQDESYELLLLPLFAQFANLHLSLLRDGAIFGSQWGWTESYVTSIEKKLTGTIKAYQDYANRVYTEGRRNVVAQAETNPRYCEPFRTENKYVREMTETVLDYLEIWGYMDSTAYPVPVMFDFFRELYSDPCGSCDDSGSIPLLYSTPPRQVWRRSPSGVGIGLTPSRLTILMGKDQTAGPQRGGWAIVTVAAVPLQQAECLTYALKP